MKSVDVVELDDLFIRQWVNKSHLRPANNQTHLNTNNETFISDFEQ